MRIFGGATRKHGQWAFVAIEKLRLRSRPEMGDFCSYFDADDARADDVDLGLIAPGIRVRKLKFTSSSTNYLL